MLTADTGTVLIRFEAENVRSFRDPIELSMVATRLAEPGAARPVRMNERGTTVPVLPVACVFGANASGKSNVLRAMADMRGCVLHSFRSGDLDTPIPRSPFRLDAISATRPTRFSVDLVLDGVRHEYGFVHTDEHFVEEWAYSYPRAKRTVLFERDGMHVAHGTRERSRGKAVEQLLRPNALFLSTSAAAGHELLMPLYRWFANNFVMAEAANRGLRHARTLSLLQDERERARVLELVRVADLGVVDVRIEPLDPDFLDRVRRAVRVLHGKESDLDADLDLSIDVAGGLRLSHAGAAGPVEFDDREESLGTVVWLGLLGPLIDALRDGTVLLADELDSSLHPRLVEEVVRLFQDPLSNPRNAQLIANAFDTSLLGDSVSPRVLGRDQIWLADKAPDGATSLRALAEFAPRKEEDLAGRYLGGRYGGVPLIDHHEFSGIVELTRS